MNIQETIQKAIKILKESGIKGLGKCRAYISDANKNEVDIFTDDGLYCTINVRSGRVKNI